MNISAHIKSIQAGIAGLAVVVLGMVAGCSPSAPPPPHPVNSIAGGAKTNALSIGQGTNVALFETNSIFDDKLKSGRNPFYPASSRQETKPGSTAGTAVPDVPKRPVESALVLNGIMGSSKHRVALINGRTFEVGDEVLIRTAYGQARVRCLEIGSDSVSITVNGKPDARKLSLKK